LAPRETLMHHNPDVPKMKKLPDKSLKMTSSSRYGTTTNAHGKCSLGAKGRGVAVCVYLFFQYSKFNNICICTARPDTTRELRRNCNELKIYISFI
jgi:hypothetical protein